MVPGLLLEQIVYFVRIVVLMSTRYAQLLLRLTLGRRGQATTAFNATPARHEGKPFFSLPVRLLQCSNPA